MAGVGIEMGHRGVLHARWSLKTHRGGVYFRCFLGFAVDFGAVRSTANTPHAV